MSPEDEAPIMTALWIFSGRFSGSHTFAPSVRVKKGNPVDWHQPWRQIFLLFILLAGQASCDNITTTPSTSPTNIPTPVFYTLNIFVDTTGQEKNESEIIAWLEQVLQQNLEMCLSPITGRPSTRPTPTRATTIGNNVTSTTAATTTIESNSTTATTTESNSTTATTTENNITNTTTDTITIESNSTTATTTENNITNTTPATTMENNSATTTAVNTEINSSTSPTIEHISSSASSTTENNTISTTTLERNSSTFTATTTSGVTTPLQTTSTFTMGLTSFTTPTTVQTSTTSTIKPSKGQSTTNATAATSPKATTPTNVTPTPPAGGNTITVATTVKTSTIPTTTPVTASSLTTAMAVSTITQTSTTAPTITLTSQTRAKTTTTPATGQTPATLASPTTTGREPVTTATPVPTQSTHPVQSIPTNQNTNSSATSVDMEGNAGPRLLSNPSGQVRKRREASGSMTPSSGTIENTTQIFQGIDVMCANKTFISQTECIVTLRLHQAVPPCCILRSLCARNENSSDILVVGRSVDRAREMSMNCSGITPGEAQGCMYSGEINGFCDADAFFTQKNPTDCPDNCTCSAFCHRNDSYYVFNIGIQDPRINVSEISSLIATIDRQPVCSPDSDGTCSALTGAFKNASVTCRNTTQNLQHCSVILGFRNSVNICSVARAVRNVLRSHEEIFFDGVVTRAAICGSFGIDDEPLQSQFTLARDNRRPGSFCENIEQSNVCFCRKRNNVAVLLEEQCDVRNETMPLNSTTAPPNVTSTFNTTTPQLNTTDMVNATTANVTVTFNSTTIQPNTTESINTTTANVTVGFNSTTTAQPNTTEIINSTTPSVSAIFNTATQQPNVTQIVNATTVNVTMTFNTTTQQPNTTQIVNATTVNVTMIFNLTTPQPNTTQMANATTTMTMTFNSTTLRPNTTQNVNATTTNATTTLNSTRPPERTTPSANATAATPQNTPLMNNATTTVGAVTQTASPTTTASPQAIANDLLNLTRDISSLNSSQVNDLLSQLESLLSASSISMELANTSIHIVSNLLEASPETLAESTNRIINIVDTVGLRLELGTEAEVLVAPLLSLSATPIDGTNFQETSFSVLNPSDVQVRGDRVRRVRRSMRVDSSIPQASVTLPPSLTQDLTPEEQQQASRLHFNFYQRSTVYQDSSLGTERRLNSGILGANVANLSLSGLQDNVTINLRHLEPTPANFVTTCVFWDTVLNDGSGGWNPDGCTVVNSTDNETICGCNHLTSFAILLNLGREPITSRLQATILTFITYIGCGISAIFLSITLLTYLAFGKLRKDIPSKILIQLCFALLLLNLVFLVDAWLALYPDAVGLCISTAWFLHYFLLVSFTWMGVEAFHMYQALVKVFNSHISCYMLRCSVVGWGVPMIVVIIVIAIDKDNYGLVTYARFIDGTTDDFCWLRNDIAFYVAVVAYFCVIFVFNFAMFIVVLVQLHRIRRANPHNNRHRSTIQDVRSVSGITILLGLTWGFAFFAWGPVNLPFMYLFAIFNSLQGFFIFVFYCAVKENVRRQWRTYLCCGKLRLAENSEWSRTATQKTAKRSSVTNVTSVNSTNGQNSSSSTTFLVSDSPQPNNGVDNPLQDTVITADDTPGAVGHSEANNTRHRNRPVS